MLRSLPPAAVGQRPCQAGSRLPCGAPVTPGVITRRPRLAGGHRRSLPDGPQKRAHHHPQPHRRPGADCDDQRASCAGQLSGCEHQGQGCAVHVYLCFTNMHGRAHVGSLLAPARRLRPAGTPRMLHPAKLTPPSAGPVPAPHCCLVVPSAANPDNLGGTPVMQVYGAHQTHAAVLLRSEVPIVGISLEVGRRSCHAQTSRDCTALLL